MENLQYLPRITKRQHIITLKDIFAYYDVTKLTGKGNLRMIYGRKDKRDLVVSIFNVYIAEMFDKFVEGGFVYNFPDRNESKLLFSIVPSHIVKKSKAEGKLKKLDTRATNNTGIKTVLRLASTNAFYDSSVLLSENFQNRIYSNLNNKVNLLGRVDKFWRDFMSSVYITFPDINQGALDRVVLFGLKKMIFFLSKNLEIFLTNTNAGEYIYIGKQINKHNDIDFRYKIMTKQYIKKLRWHWNSKREFTDDRYYCLTEEMYQNHLNGKRIETVILKKVKEECLIGKQWYKYVMKTTHTTTLFSTLLKDYDSSSDKLIFIKPQV